MTKSLGESWNLGSALASYLSGESSKENTLIAEGQHLAKAAKKGWKSDEAKQSIESIARALNQPYLDIQDIVLGTAKQAQK